MKADDGRADAAAEGVPGYVAPLGVWLALQIGLLLLPVLQTPLSDQFARPAERVALELMLVGQVCFAAILFPWLLRSIGSAIVVAAASWPFVQLAMVLSSADAGRVLAAGAYLTLWIAILAGWRSLLASQRAQMTGAALAATLSGGGVLLWYLRAEFVRHSGGAQWGTDALLGPVMGILAIIHGAGQNAWLAISTLAVLTAATIFIAHRRRRQATIVAGS